MAEVILKDLYKTYQKGLPVVHGINLHIKDKEFVALVGPSGCGKSTTLRMVAGLEDITAGEIMIGDQIVNDLPPRDRDIAMVFQNYALYQHMTVYENLAFGLKNKKVPNEKIKEAIAYASSILGLNPLLDRKPSQLSGGQQQRVALGRCIVRNPKVFLFDEPLSNLDAQLRSQMRIELKRLRSRVETTSIFVTHDQVEAMTLGDRVVVMKDGYIKQAGTPLEVYSRPANRFVASFIGSPSMNIVDAKIITSGTGLAADTGWAKIPVAADLNLQGMNAVAVGIRPEHIVIGGDVSTGDHVTFQVRIEVIEHLGAQVLLEVAAGHQILTISGVNPYLPLNVDDVLNCSFAVDKAYFFNIQTEEALYA